MTWTIQQQLSMLYYLSVYALEPCCLSWVWVFGCFWLSACDRERKRGGEREGEVLPLQTAKPHWGCCGNKTLGSRRYVVNEEEY